MWQVCRGLKVTVLVYKEASQSTVVFCVFDTGNNYCRLLRRIAMTLVARTDVGRGTFGPHQDHQAIHTIYHLPSFTMNGFALRLLCICKV
jgi:hypothetical protein